VTQPSRGHAERRLGEEKIAWLTTVRRDGQPQSSPVWFLWRDGEIIVYSRPTTQKVRNVQAHPKVAVHLRDIDDGPEQLREGVLGPDPHPADPDAHRIGGWNDRQGDPGDPLLRHVRLFLEGRRSGGRAR